MIVGLDHVQLAAPAGCEEDAREYFGELLGLVEVEKPPALRERGGVWFSVGAQQLHVGVDRAFTPAVKAHPALGIAAGRLEALAERLIAARVEVMWDENVPGVRRFFSSDPWGNRIEFVEANTS